jgi:hypothetical protein
MHTMKRIFFAVTSSLLLMISAGNAHAQTGTTWTIHDVNRPVPTVITPGTSSTPDSPGKAPSDAIILFDGKDLSQWLAEDNGPAKWKVENGYAEVVAKAGYVHTKQPFGDCQLHVEFYEPVPPKGESQERGNSGVFLMGVYEIQVLDSYQNKTYADGQAAAVYGQYPPLVNASRPPGQWQTYDIVFHAPHFDAPGKLLKPARVTVFQNGVLVQDNVEIKGRTAIGDIPTYVPGPDKAPLALQDHGNPVRYRNIWIREL